MHVAIVEMPNDTGCIVLVLNLHACEATHVNVVSEVLAACKVLACDHVEIKGLIGLVLAVGNATAL